RTSHIVPLSLHCALPISDRVPASSGNSLGLLRGDALHAPAHQHAPCSAAEVIVIVDLEGDIRLLGKGGEDAVLTRTHEDIAAVEDRKSTRLNSSHVKSSY